PLRLSCTTMLSWVTSALCSCTPMTSTSTSAVSVVSDSHVYSTVTVAVPGNLPWRVAILCIDSSSAAAFWKPTTSTTPGSSLSHVHGISAPGAGLPIAVTWAGPPTARVIVCGKTSTCAPSAPPVVDGFPPQCHPPLMTPTPGSELSTVPSSLTVPGPMLTNCTRSWSIEYISVFWPVDNPSTL